MPHIDESTAARANPARAGGLLFLLLAGTTVVLAIPFLGGAPVIWAEKNVLLLAGTLSLAAAVFVHGALTTSPGRALAFLATAVGVAMLAERSGLVTGFPFGARYAYHPDLQPRVLGGVPLFIPLAWYVIASAPVVLLRRRRRSPVGGRGTGRAVLGTLLAAIYLAGTDLFLDPLSVAVNAWTWEGGGAYFGVPWSNFLGWILVGCVVFPVAFVGADASPSPRTRRLDRAYVVVTLVLTLLGFAATVARVGDVRAVLLPSLVLGPYWIVWARDSTLARGG